MSYTPENQRFDGRLEKAANALQEVCDVIRERLKVPGEWDAENLREMSVLLQDCTKFEVQLRLLGR